MDIGAFLIFLILVFVAVKLLGDFAKWLDNFSSGDKPKPIHIPVMKGFESGANISQPASSRSTPLKSSDDGTKAFERLMEEYRLGEKASGPVAAFKKSGVTSIWHMTHISNLNSIVTNGLVSKLDAFTRFSPTDISDHGVQEHRKRSEPCFGRSIQNYTPFYFSVRNPMLFTKKDSNSDLCLIEISIDCIEGREFVFTDGNAASKQTKFFCDVDKLDRLPWDVLRSEFWTGFLDGKRKKCAEVLVHGRVEPHHIKAIHCHSLASLNRASKISSKAKLTPGMYF
jgi:hypothetical protein